MRCDGQDLEIEARRLVPGDVLLVDEGDSICADARLMTGAVEVDLSTLTGESVPVARSAGPADAGVPLLQAADAVFSGTACTGETAEVLGQLLSFDRITRVDRHDPALTSRFRIDAG